MAYKPPIVILDACVLYPFHLRNLLIQCAVDRLINAHWTEAIHHEWIRNLLDNNPHLSRKAIMRTRELMDRALPNALVTDYENHISKITLKDSDDRHVVAAGIATGASSIITWNIRDFPKKEIKRYALTAITPDDLLMDLHKKVPNLLVEATLNARLNLTKSAISMEDFLKALKRQKLGHFIKAMAPNFTRP